MRIKNRLLAVCFNITIILTGSTFGAQIKGKWKIDYVDPNVLFSGPAVTLLNDNGKPLLASATDNITGLYYHYRDSNAWDVNSKSWESVIVEPVDCTKILGIDISNNDRIVYRTYDGSIRFAEKSGGSWHTETIAASPVLGYRKCFVVNSEDEPIVLLREGAIVRLNLKLYYRDDGPFGKVWVSTLLDTDEGGRIINGNIICDDFNVVHVSYIKEMLTGYCRLYYVKYNDGNCINATTFDLTSGAEITDVKIGPEGNYYVLVSYNRCICVYDGQNWDVIDYSEDMSEMVDYPWGEPCLHFDNAGKLQIRTLWCMFTYDSNSWSMDYLQQQLSQALTSIHHGVIVNSYLDKFGNACAAIADYDVGGVVHCQYVKDANTIMGINIKGPENVNEQTSTRYQANGYYDNYTSKDITDLVDWSVDKDTYAFIDSNDMFVARNIQEQQQVLLHAEYHIDDLYFSDERKINILPIHLDSDLDKDGQVAFSDFALMAADWLKGEK